jgi:signal transduction histidine kinase
MFGSITRGVQQSSKPESEKGWRIRSLEFVLRSVPDFSWVKVHSRHQDKKKVLINVQWLVVATSCFLLFNKGQVIQDPWAFSLILVLLSSSIALYRLPQRAFDHGLFALTLVVVDTILVGASIGLTRESPWDLFIVFFFGLFIAATGDTLIKIVAGCLIFAIVPVIMTSLSGVALSRLDSDLLFRLPFLFGVFILYGYLDDQARKEKIRAEKAEATERLKRQLVSALAHDIKNPLGIIMGYAETVTTRLEERPKEKENLEAMESIQENAQRIVKLVTGFLDASKAESGKMELVPKPTQLNVLLREVGQQQMGALHRKDISLKVNLDAHLPEIMGDAGQLDRVLWNLVGNAIKFTPNGGTITLTSSFGNGTVCVCVEDTGMGISQEEIDLLFSEFRRLKGANKVEGSGLGLFVVKTVVQAHGGTVDVTSKEGKGSTFTIRFPARP